MTRATVVFALVVLALSGQVNEARAQTLSDAQSEVWAVVVESWEAIRDKDIEWIDRYVHPDAIVWGTGYPMPRNRESTRRWNRYEFENSTTLAHDFSPGGIVVHGDTAVAHYYYSLGSEDRDGKRRTVHGRCTDILIREGGSWQFLAWNCGDTPNTDD